MTAIRTTLALLLLLANGGALCALLFRGRPKPHAAELAGIAFALGLLVAGGLAYVLTLVRVQAALPAAAVALAGGLLYAARRDLGELAAALRPPRARKRGLGETILLALAFTAIFGQFCFLLFYVTRMPSWGVDVLHSSAYTGREIARSGRLGGELACMTEVLRQGHLLWDMAAVYLYRCAGTLDPFVARAIEPFHLLLLASVCGGYLARRKSAVHGALFAAGIALVPAYVHQVLIGYRDLALAGLALCSAVMLERFLRGLDWRDLLLAGVFAAGLPLVKKMGFLYLAVLLVVGGAAVLWVLARSGATAAVRRRAAATAGVLGLLSAGLVGAGLAWHAFGTGTFAPEEPLQDPAGMKVLATVNVAFYEFFLPEPEPRLDVAPEWGLFWLLVVLCVALHPVKALRREGFWLALGLAQLAGFLALAIFGASLELLLPSVERYLLPASGTAILLAGSLAPDLGAWQHRKQPN